jgi:hypothetical protein
LRGFFSCWTGFHATGDAAKLATYDPDDDGAVQAVFWGLVAFQFRFDLNGNARLDKVVKARLLRETSTVLPH